MLLEFLFHRLLIFRLLPTVATNTAGVYNVWPMSSRLMPTFRVTRNPPNTRPCTGVLSGGLVNGAFGSFHTGGVNFAFVDGSVRFVKDTVSLAVYQALSTRDLGEVVSSDQY